MEKDLRMVLVLGTYQQLAQKVYKGVNMFLETSSVLRKKGSGKEQLKILKKLTKNCRYLK
jgi:hypothetical protein